VNKRLLPLYNDWRKDYKISEGFGVPMKPLNFGVREVHKILLGIPKTLFLL
jgi:hypothetical protein